MGTNTVNIRMGWYTHKTKSRKCESTEENYELIAYQKSGLYIVPPDAFCTHEDNVVQKGEKIVQTESSRMGSTLEAIDIV